MAFYGQFPALANYLTLQTMVLMSIFLVSCGYAPISKPQLHSDRDLDFSQLETHLSAKDWQASDEETYTLMAASLGKRVPIVERLEAADLLELPCADLNSLDQLWNYHSNGRFSFTIQKNNYVAAGGRLKATSSLSTDRLIDFTNRNGWYSRPLKRFLSGRDVDVAYRADNDFLPPKGFLPFFWWAAGVRDVFLSGGGGQMVTVTPEFASHLFTRLDQCQTSS